MLISLLLVVRKYVSYKTYDDVRGTNLLEEIVDVEVHLQNCLLSPLVVKSNNECTRGRRGDIEVDVGTSI